MEESVFRVVSLASVPRSLPRTLPRRRLRMDRSHAYCPLRCFHRSRSLLALSVDFFSIFQDYLSLIRITHRIISRSTSRPEVTIGSIHIIISHHTPSRFSQSLVAASPRQPLNPTTQLRLGRPGLLPSIHHHPPDSPYILRVVLMTPTYARTPLRPPDLRPFTFLSSSPTRRHIPTAPHRIFLPPIQCPYTRRPNNSYSHEEGGRYR